MPRTLIHTTEPVRRDDCTALRAARLMRLPDRPVRPDQMLLLRQNVVRQPHIPTRLGFFPAGWLRRGLSYVGLYAVTHLARCCSVRLQMSYYVNLYVCTYIGFDATRGE